MRTINIGIIGCGVVGTSFINQLHEKHQRIIDEFNIDFKINAILVNNTKAKRAIPKSSPLFNFGTENIITNDSEKLDESEIIIEVAGGIEPTYQLICNALSSGKPVVTANKALLAEKGSELYSLANQNNVDLLFEAAVGGGIPLVRPIRESLAVEHIDSVKGILNGTTNFILSQMTQKSISYEDALKQAQELGYAEADPTADVEGYDAAAKIAIISLLATGTKASQSDVYTKGISSISAHDISSAKDLGYVIKLIASIEDKNEDEVILRVEPTLVSTSHPFSTVNDGFNAVFVKGSKLGETMFYGRGAGGDPTATAVLGDLIDAGLNITHTRKGATVGYEFDRKVADPHDWVSKFYISLTVLDEPGVLAKIATTFGENNVSIETVRQNGMGDSATLALITHEALDAHLQKAVGLLGYLGCVTKINSVMPIID